MILNDQQFQKLKQGFQTGAKSLGVMADQAFQGLRKGLDTYRNLPGVKQVYQTSQKLMADPNRTSQQQTFEDALNVTPIGIAGTVEKNIGKGLARQLSARGGTEELVKTLTGKAKVMGQLILDGLKRIKDPIDQIELEEILHNGIARGFTPESEKKALNVLRAYPTDPVSKETMDFSVSKLPKNPPRFTKGDKGLFSGSKPSSPLAQEVGKYKTAEEFANSIHEKVMREGGPDAAEVTALKHIQFDTIPTPKAHYKLDLNDKRTRGIVDYWKKQIKTGKEVPPIVLDESGKVIDGAHRIEAYKELGIKNVQIVKPAKDYSQLTDLFHKLKGELKGKK